FCHKKSGQLLNSLTGFKKFSTLMSQFQTLLFSSKLYCIPTDGDETVKANLGSGSFTLLSMTEYRSTVLKR
ncbi:hypothetical protein JQC92_21970, partial [Shewanella sp. 202IG2-18]|uniref:hypothetical protein n=1 Tax=Parashewanella hymeniacidonis TaxID=2807618 RepID=UPI00196154FF